MPALKVLGLVRFAAAIATVVAIVALIIRNKSAGVYNGGNFFSFFTVDSNIIIALVFLISGLAAVRGLQTNELSGLRGAATLYIVVTGIIYNLLLADLQESLQTNLQWANFVVHTLIPIVALLDFLVDRTVARLGLRNAVLWLIFPLLWFGYTLIRGAIVDWYPYPFLDPRLHSWGRIVLVCVVIAVGIAVLALIIAYSTRVLNRSTPKPERASVPAGQ